MVEDDYCGVATGSTLFVNLSCGKVVNEVVGKRRDENAQDLVCSTTLRPHSTTFLCGSRNLEDLIESKEG